MIFGYRKSMSLITHPEVSHVDFMTFSKLFVIGPTKVGKTTFCRKVNSEIGELPLHIQASGWIKERFKKADKLPDYERANFLAEKSLDILAKEPKACVNWIRKKLNCCGGGVILDGIRNPQDFFDLFDPAYDYVVFLKRDGIDYANDFEKGIITIRSYTEWAENNLKKQRMATFDDIILDISLDKEEN